MNQNLHLRPKDQAHYKTRVYDYIFFFENTALLSSEWQTTVREN